MIAVCSPLPTTSLPFCFVAAALPEEHLDSESTFCSARYYKPLVHKSGYGNQVHPHNHHPVITIP